MNAEHMWIRDQGTSEGDEVTLRLRQDLIPILSILCVRVQEGDDVYG